MKEKPISKPKITIVGLGVIGAAIGRKLCLVGGQLEIVGHDREPMVAKEAQRSGAIHRLSWNLLDACDGADLVIIATPLKGVHDTLAAIAADLKPGCLVMDTASLKVPVLTWADELLPEEVSFVGCDPIPNTPSSSGDPDSPNHPDVLKGSLFCLVPSVKASPESIHLATDVARLLDATPLFLDAAEHDGLVAGVEQVPAVLSLALMRSLSEIASWREMRKLAGPIFDDTTRVLSQDPAALRDALLLNRDNVMRIIDGWTETLRLLRDMLQSQDEAGLDGIIGAAAEVHEQWLHDRSTGLWDKPQAPEIPTGGGFLGRMFGMRGRDAGERQS